MKLRKIKRFIRSWRKLGYSEFEVLTTESEIIIIVKGNPVGEDTIRIKY